MQNLVAFGSVISEGMRRHTYIVLRNNIWFHYDQFGLNLQSAAGWNEFHWVSMLLCYENNLKIH